MDASVSSTMPSRSPRLAHGWKLVESAALSAELLGDFIRPAVRAVPSSLARRLGPCRIPFVTREDAALDSRWAETGAGLEISIMTAGRDDHDLAMELLLCLGQALWERLSDAQFRAWWLLVADEIRDGVPGEIDEQALEEKRALLGGRHYARSPRRLARYGRASFAGTAAEYVHSLWHDVTVRTGPGHLPAPQLHRRLELLARWFPPNRGYRLFAPGGGQPPSAAHDCSPP